MRRHWGSRCQPSRTTGQNSRETLTHNGHGRRARRVSRIEASRKHFGRRFLIDLGLSGSRASLSAPCLPGSRVVRGKSAQHMAGEAHFQSGAENVGCWARPWVPLKVVEVEQQARVEAHSRTGLEAVLVEVGRGKIKEDLVIEERVGATVGTDRAIQQKAIAITDWIASISDELFPSIAVGKREVISMGCPGQSQQGQMDQIIALWQVGKQVAGGQGQAPTERQIGGEPGGSKFGIRRPGFDTRDERRQEVYVPPGGAQINFVP